MNENLKILFIEDVQLDVELIWHHLKTDNIKFSKMLVETEAEFLGALSVFIPDIIISDYSLPQFTGMRALIIKREIAPLIPFILVTGSINEKVAVDCMKAGADDYILKENLSRLGEAIKSALKKKEIDRQKEFTEKKLRASEAHLNTLMQTIPDLIWLKDIDGTYLACNTMFESFFGAKESDIIGKTDYDFVDSELADSFREYDRKAMASEKQSRNEEWITFSDDGRMVCLDTIKTPIIDKAGILTGVLGTSRDITGLKKAEEELIQARDKAEEGDKLKTAFLHNISHEIRTPMNAITGFSALLTEPDLSKETQTSYIEIINQSSDHLLFILNDIIEISNIDAGILKLKKSGTNLNSLLERLYKEFSDQAAEKKIELGLKTGLTDAESYVNIDSGKLLQVLSNLLRNSLKFTHSGKIEFGYKLTDVFLQFYVSDTGIGIPEDQLQKIFNRFYQVEHTETRQYDGTGLGLSISKEYVEMMNGRIWVTSKPGIGSVFYFTTPFEKYMNVNDFNVQPGNIRKPGVSRKKTILVAEDDNSNFHLIKQLLSGLDLEIIHACNGIEAVDICKSEKKIDLVLMDIKMPLMDGYEATKEILHNSPSVKIVVQTAYADDIARSLEAGCVGFITKPFNRKQFVEIVKEFL